MKKFIGVLLLVLSLFVCACGSGNNDQPSLSIEEQIMNVLSQYGISYAEGESKDSIKSDIILPSISSGVVSISIESSNQAVISNEGKVTRPEKDTNVTLTIKGTIGDTTLEKQIVVKVLAKDNKEGGDDNQEILDRINAFLNAITISFADGETIDTVKSDISLNVSDDNDIEVMVSISNGMVIDSNGKVTQQIIDTKVTITVTASIGEVSVDKKFEITVLAKDGEDAPTQISIAEALEIGNALEDNTKTEEVYVVTGVITELQNTIYGNALITEGDSSVLLWGIVDAEGNKYSALDYKPVENDKVTVCGNIKKYVDKNNNVTIEIESAVLISYAEGEHNEKQVVNVTIPEALVEGNKLEAEATSEATYATTGTITSVDNTTYGNLYISDGTNEIYVYGVFDAKGNRYDVLEYQPVEGDEISFTGKIKKHVDSKTSTTIIEFVNATLTNIVKGQGGGGGEHSDGTTIAEIHAMPEAKSVKVYDAQVVATYTKGFLVNDGTGSILVYLGKGTDLVVGDIVTIEGTFEDHNSSWQFPSSSTYTKTGNKAYTDPTPTEYTGPGIDIYLSLARPTIGEFIEVTGTMILESSYYNVSVEGTLSVIAIQYPAASFNLSSMGAENVTLQGYIIGQSSDACRLNVMLVSIQVNDDDTPAEVKTISEIQASTEIMKAKVENAQIVAFYYDGFIVNDGTGSMIVYYGEEDYNYRLGDILTIEGKTSQYHNVWQMSAADVEITKTSTGSVSDQVATEMDAAAIAAFVKATPKTVGQYIKVTGKLAVTPTKLSLMFEGISNLVVIKGYDQDWDLANKAKYTICIEAYIISFDYEGTSLEVQAVNLVSATPEEEDDEPEGDKIDFISTFGTYAKEWNDRYAVKTFSAKDLGFTGNADVNVVLANASKQATINNMPTLASKGVEQYVTITGTLKDYTGVTFYLEQWGTKTLNSIKIQYTTDGTNWTDCSDVITTPGKLTSSAFANAVSVRLVYIGGSSSKNVQMGIAKIIFTK